MEKPDNVSQIKYAMGQHFDRNIMEELTNLCKFRFEKKKEYSVQSKKEINNWYGHMALEDLQNHMHQTYNNHSRLKAEKQSLKGNGYDYVVLNLDNTFSIYPQSLSYLKEVPCSNIARSHSVQIGEYLFEQTTLANGLIPVILAMGGNGEDNNQYFSFIGVKTPDKWIKELKINLMGSTIEEQDESDEIVQYLKKPPIEKIEEVEVIPIKKIKKTGDKQI